MPTGTTSYASRSIARSTLPAVTQEMACSLERPPKTTATRGLRGSFIVHDPSGPAARRPAPPRLGTMPEETPQTAVTATPRRPATVAVTAGRPAHEPDAPLNAPLTMASVYVAGGDLEYGRYTNPTWTAFEEALGALEGGRCLAFSSGLAAVSTLLDLVGLGSKVVAPRHAYLGSIGQLADLEARGRVTRGAGRHRRHRRRASPRSTTPRCCGSSRRPTRRSRSPTCPG